jgi:hypothetical protein
LKKESVTEKLALYCTVEIRYLYYIKDYACGDDVKRYVLNPDSDLEPSFFDQKFSLEAQKTYASGTRTLMFS